MAFLLVRVRNSVRDVAVLGNGVLNGVSGDASPGVAVGAIDNALPTGVCAQPEQAVVQFGYGVCRRAANLIERPLDTLQREIHRPCVVPDLN